ncbi:MAG: hypothetical protein PUG84_00755 [Peptoniphilaceae bacterium]|nr:hypothetical protein [Peptoniphilaceae bacterium]
MKLRQVYNELIRIYLKKENNRVIDMDVGDRNCDWITDGVSVWAIPKENPFNFKKYHMDWFDSIAGEGLPVIKVTRSPHRDSKDLIKLETEEESHSLYLDEKRLKWFDKGYELKLSKEFFGDTSVCQVYEDKELRGLIIGMRVAEDRQF